MKLMQTNGTQQILNRMENKTSAKTGEKQAYWVEFLGNYDGKERAEDSVFSTAVVMNTLIDIWTIGSDSSS